MKKIITVILVILTLSLSGCGQIETTDNGKVSVYTSFNAMYQFTKEIAGDKANVECLMPSGAEPHDWEPSAADIVKLEKADVFVYSSDKMETWAEKVINSIENENIKVVETAEEVLPIELHSHEQSEEKHEGHDHSDGDPHVWLDPENAKIQMQAITDALCEADSANAEYYKSNLSSAIQKLEALDAEYENLLSGEGEKYIIVSHEAYGYLCSAYGMEQVGIKGVMAENEPSPAKMAEIVSFAKEHNIKYVFAENSKNTKVAQIVADEIDGEVLILSPFESGEEDYFTVMENNLEALKKAFGNGE